MIYSKIKENFFSITNIYFSRLKLIKTEYIEWKKKIDDGRKQIPTMDDEQITEQYKPFYEVKKETKRNF
jgi:hypothetical protein